VENRTLRDFVEDLASNGRHQSEIIGIANNTRWKGKKNEIILICKSLKIKDLRKRRKKK